MPASSMSNDAGDGFSSRKMMTDEREGKVSRSPVSTAREATNLQVEPGVSDSMNDRRRA